MAQTRIGKKTLGRDFNKRLSRQKKCMNLKKKILVRQKTLVSGSIDVSSGAVLTFWRRIGLDKNLQDWILAKVRKHLSQKIDV